LVDVEADLRRNLIEMLSPNFTCREEVNLLHSRVGSRIRADVIAIPIDGEFQNCAFAFEVKKPKENWQPKNWSHAFRQAHSYLDAKIPSGLFQENHGERYVALSFVFPSPGWIITNPPRTEHQSELAGILQLAGNLRIGHVEWRMARSRYFCLALGATPVWESHKGWTTHASQHLKGVETIGSRRMVTRSNNVS
jgi:hypothetical protein